MNTPENHPIVSACRGLRLTLHVLGGVVRAGLLLPWLSPEGRNRQVRRWSSQLLNILGVRLHATGNIPGLDAAPALMVANHTSWLDICALNAVCPGRFVAKSEVRGWPIFGWLAKQVNTCFIRRGHLRDLWVTRHVARKALLRGERIIVFPEGTTTDGKSVLPFRTGLVQSAVDAGSGVLPVMIRYVHAEQESPAVFVGDMTFMESLRRILRSPGFHVELCFLEVLDARRSNRRSLCAQARQLIAGELASADIRTGWVTEQAEDGCAPEGLLVLSDEWSAATG